MELNQQINDKAQEIVKIFKGLDPTKFENVVYNNFAVEIEIAKSCDNTVDNYRILLVDKPIDPIPDVEPTVYAYFTLYPITKTTVFVRFFIDNYINTNAEIFYTNITRKQDRIIDYLKTTINNIKFQYNLII